MTASWKKWTRNDIIFGFIVPLIVALVIVAFPLLTPFLASINPALIGILVWGLEEQILIVAIPLFLGLLWNQWAGGASGFILGSIYALSYSHQYLLGNVFAIVRGDSFSGGFFGGGSDSILLGYLVSAMLIGYLAGSLNKGSDNFLRMLISGLVAATTGALLLFLSYHLSPLNVVTGPFGLFLTVVPRLLFAIIIPVVAKIFMWFDIVPKTNK